MTGVCKEELQEFSSLDVDLKPLSQRPVLVTVTDEEACQYRALNLLFGPLRVRGMPIPEYNHPAWNDFSRSLVSSGLKGSVLKGTLIRNHYAGPYKSGKFGYDIQVAARKFLLSCSADCLEELSNFEYFKEQFFTCVSFVYIG